MDLTYNLNFNEKCELATWIVNNNVGTAISGSLVLKYYNIIDREPNDIDIIIYNKDILAEDLILPPFSKIIETQHLEGYDVVKRIEYLGNKIEFILVDSDLNLICDSGIDISDYTSYKSETLDELLKNFDQNIKYRHYTHPYITSIEDILKAKKHYLKHNINKDYIEKTENDINLIEQWLFEHSDYIKENESYIAKYNYEKNEILYDYEITKDIDWNNIINSSLNDDIVDFNF